MKDGDYPALYREADRTSMEQQSAFLRTIKAHAFLSVCGAVFVAYSTKSQVSAIVAAVFFAALIGVSLLLAFKRFERGWYQGRAVAESVKTMTWRFVLKAEPYHDCKNSESLFRDRLKRTLEENRELSEILTGAFVDADQITPRMRRIRDLSLEDRRNLYLQERIEEQQSWYKSKTAFNRQMARRFLIAMISLQSAAFVCVLINIGFPEVRLPTEAFVVCGGAALTWMQVKRFRELAAAYSLTALEIGIVKTRVAALTDEAEFSAFIGDAENAFSREHTQWVARRDT